MAATYFPGRLCHGAALRICEMIRDRIRARDATGVRASMIEGRDAIPVPAGIHMPRATITAAMNCIAMRQRLTLLPPLPSLSRG
jgi:hypothetical protein